MRNLAAAEIDKAEALPIGRGSLEASLFARGDFDDGGFGAALDYSHHVREGLSAFARGEVGYSYGDAPGLGYNGLAGLRVVF